MNLGRRRQSVPRDLKTSVSKSEQASFDYRDTHIKPLQGRQTLRKIASSPSMQIKFASRDVSTKENENAKTLKWEYESEFRPRTTIGGSSLAAKIRRRQASIGNVFQIQNDTNAVEEKVGENVIVKVATLCKGDFFVSKLKYIFVKKSRLSFFSVPT